MKYREWSHNKQDCRYHIVWITKYRRKCLSEPIRKRLQGLLEEISKEMYVDVISIGMEEDHVHMYVNIPVSQYIPYVVKKRKWISSKEIRKEFKEELKEYFWNPVLWAVGYFICTVWEITSEHVKKYVEEQWRKDVLEDGFNV